MLNGFFDKPSGVGSPVNAYMFRPHRLKHALKILVTEPRYFLSRVNVLIYQASHPSAPWLTSEAIRFLDRYLHRGMHGFEWGSGRSTRWLAQRLASLVSIEDDEMWFRRVQSRLAGLNVDYRYMPRSAGGAAYAAQIATLSEHRFDIVLIDGSARDACIMAAVPRVKTGGVIVLDNADLDYDVSPLTHFHRISTDNGVWRTDIYVDRGSRRGQSSR